MRPPDQYKDVTAALARGVSMNDFVDSVNLHMEEPPIETWEKPSIAERRPVMALSGHAIGERVPIRLFLQHHEQGTLTDLDLWVWIRMEDRSGNSGVAYLTASEIARLQGVHRDAVRASLRRLADVGLVEQERRGRWSVFNPTRENRHGQIDLSGTFRNRDEMLACSTACPDPHSHVPHTSSRNAETRRASTRCTWRHCRTVRAVPTSTPFGTTSPFVTNRDSTHQYQRKQLIMNVLPVSDMLALIHYPRGTEPLVRAAVAHATDAVALYEGPHATDY